MSDLKELYLNDNQIVNIKNYAFNDLASLKVLVLSNNKLEELFKKMFREIPQLEALELDNNRINYIDNYSFETNTSLLRYKKYLDISMLFSLAGLPDLSSIHFEIY